MFAIYEFIQFLKFHHYKYKFYLFKTRNCNTHYAYVFVDDWWPKFC